MRIRSKKLIIALTSAALLIISCFSSTMLLEARGIPSDDAFDNLVWTELFRTEPMSEGRVRSMTVTDDYIITVRNMADDESVKDTVTAYYRNDHDAKGLPVTQYSEALSVTNDQLEMGNSLTYNKKTGKLYLAPCTCYDAENYGNILVIDPVTLKVEEREFITYEFGVSGIEYVEDSDSYIIQSDFEKEYTFSVYNAELDPVSVIGRPDILPSSSARDFTVCGNYIISTAYLDSEEKAYLNIYSIFDASKIRSIQMDIPMDGIKGVAPQSVAELAPGQLIVMVEETNDADETFTVFYKADVPYNFTVSTAVENGTITENSSEILRGTDYTVEFSPNRGFALSEISLDGKNLNPESYDDSITISSIDSDHSVVVRFAEKELVKKQNKDRKNAFSSLVKKLNKTAGGKVTFGKVILTVIITIIIICVIAFLLFFIVRMLKVKKKNAKSTKSPTGKPTKPSAGKSVKSYFKKDIGKSVKKSKNASDEVSGSGKGRLSKYRGTPLSRPSDQEIKSRTSFKDDYDNEKERDYLYGYDDDFYDQSEEDSRNYKVPSGMRDLNDRDYNDHNYYDDRNEYDDGDYYDGRDKYDDRNNYDDSGYYDEREDDRRNEKTKKNVYVSQDTRNLDHYYREENRTKTLVYGDEDDNEPMIPWPDEMSDNLVGHWQDGVWVTTNALGPNDK